MTGNWEPHKVSTCDPSNLSRSPARHDLADDYMQHCQASLHKYGLCVRNLLGSSVHFHKWVRFQKSQVEEISGGCFTGCWFQALLALHNWFHKSKVNIILFFWTVHFASQLHELVVMIRSSLALPTGHDSCSSSQAGGKGRATCPGMEDQLYVVSNCIALRLQGNMFRFRFNFFGFGSWNVSSTFSDLESIVSGFGSPNVSSVFSMFRFRFNCFLFWTPKCFWELICKTLTCFSKLRTFHNI